MPDALVVDAALFAVAGLVFAVGSAYTLTEGQEVLLLLLAAASLTLTTICASLASPSLDPTRTLQAGPPPARSTT